MKRKMGMKKKWKTKMNTKAKVAVAVGVAITLSVAAWMLAGRPDEPLTAMKRATGLFKPDTRAVDAATMRAIRQRLHAELRAAGLKPNAPIFMRIFKDTRELEVWVQRGSRFKRFRTYRICTFSGDLGPKLKRGDMQAPEGFYYVKRRQLNPNSSYHLSFNVGYPNRYDRVHGRTGSAIMVHGDCVSAGCFAMTDAKIREIYALAEDALRGGQSFFRLHIFPFRMTAPRMQANRDPKWRDFWRNLKEGYDLFEQTGRPPDVRVVDKRYIFRAS